MALDELVHSGPATVPELGRAAFELASCVASRDADLDEAARVIARDEPLRARVLALTNTGYYAGAQRIDDLRVAAMRLGFRVLWEVAVVEIARDEIFRPVFTRGVEARRYWRLASLAGVFAHELGTRRFGAQRASILGGLLSDVGRPLAVKAIADLESRFGERLETHTVRTIAEAARAACAVRLLDAWSLSSDVRETVLVQVQRTPLEEASQQAIVALLSQALARHVVLRGTFEPKVAATIRASIALSFERAELREVVDRIPLLADLAATL